MQNTTGNKLIPSLQALRALAFIGIFAEHSIYLTFGAWGVSVFFMLSGFLMMYSYYDRKLPSTFLKSFSFSLRKIKKLYFLHLYMLVLVLLLRFLNKCLIEKSYSFNLPLFLHNAKLVIANIFLVQTWFPRVDISISCNGPAWFLSVCLFLYLIFPYIAIFIKKHLTAKQVLPAILAVYFIQFFTAYFSRNLGNLIKYSDNWQQWLTYCCPVFRSGDFIIGCLAGYAFANIPSQKQSAQRVTLFSLFEAFIIIVIFMLSRVYQMENTFLGSAWIRYTLLFEPSTLVLIILFAKNYGVFSKLFSNKIMIWIGDMSPYAFLIHVPVITLINILFRKYFGLWQFVIGKATLSLIITLLFSFLYCRLQKKLHIKRAA